MSSINRYTDANHNVTFQTGNTYRNFIGQFRVEDIEINENDLTAEPLMLVEYTDIIDSTGNPLSQILPIREQGRFIHNAIKRSEHQSEMSQVNFNSPDFIATAGYLAQYGRIRIECPRCMHEQFEAIYKHITGDDATNHFNHGYAIVKDETKGSSFELRISFVTPSEDINLFNLAIVATPNRMEINYVDFVCQLFRLGFTIGENIDNMDKIFDNLSEAQQEYFYRGMEIIPEALVA